MLIANDANGDRILATPKQTGICGSCGETLIAKCGRINIWHWSHKAQSNCPYSSKQSLWSYAWKSFFPVEQIEIPVTNNGVTRIADIVTRYGEVIELRSDTPDPYEIEEIEDFYGSNQRWVFNAIGVEGIRGLELRPRDTYYTFRWKHPRKRYGYCTNPVYLELALGRIFQIKKIHPVIPCGGWGYIWPTVKFVGGLGGRWLEGMNKHAYVKASLVRAAVRDGLYQEQFTQ